MMWNHIHQVKFDLGTHWHLKCISLTARRWGGWDTKMSRNSTTKGRTGEKNTLDSAWTSSMSSPCHCSSIITIVVYLLRCVQVIQAFFLEESFYTADDWTNITSGFSKDVDNEEGFFSGLAATARLFQSTRRALSQDTTSKEEKDRLISRASTLRQTMTDCLSDLSKRLNKARDIWAEDMHTIKNKFDHGSCTRSYGLALSTQIQVNCLLSALRGELSDSIKRENAGLCQEICKLGESDATYHRPLGSGWIFIALSVAYTVTSSIQDKTRVVKVLADYTCDFPKEKAEVQMAGMEHFAKYLRCDDLTQKSGR
jgi:hypothetical protein